MSSTAPTRHLSTRHTCTPAAAAAAATAAAAAAAG